MVGLAARLLFDAARAECGDPAALVTEVEQAVLEGRWEEVPAAEAALVEAFGCGPVADRELAARMWLAEALLRSSRDGDAEAAEPLAAAVRTSPTTWNNLLGPKLRRAWEDAARAPAPPNSSLQVAVPAGWITAVDGQLVPLPADLPAGLHLVQIGPNAGRMGGALTVDLPPDADLVVSTPLDPTAAAEPPPSGKRKRRVLQALAVGGASAALYTLTFGTRAAFYSSAPPQGRLTMARVNNVLVVVSAGGGLASGVLLAQGLITPVGAP